MEISQILLQEAQQPPFWSQYSGMILIVGIFIVMYFFMIRPQAKKAKDQKLFVNELKAGDKIVTISGLHGKIVKAEDDTYLVEIDTNTKIRIERSAVSMEYTKAMLNRKQAS